MNQEEIWKPVNGYEGYFEISNLGRVKSVERYVRQSNHLRFVPEKIKKIHFNKGGYPCVTLCKDRVSKEKLLHRLLMEAFVPNPEGKTQIDHINTNVKDYRLENLRWVTPKENSNNPLTLQHGRENIYTPERNRKMNLTRKKGNYIRDIYQYTKDGKFVEYFFSSRDAERKTGISCTHILSILDDNTQSAGGFLWFSKKVDGISYVPRIHPSSKAVLHYDLSGNLLGEYQSIKVASKHTGITTSSIYRSLRSKFKKPRKYIFRFKDNPL